MAKIPEQKYDITISKMKDEIEKKYNEEFEVRNYLGMSQIGEECWRKLFYSYRKARPHNLHINSILAIEDGHKQEKGAISRLSLLPGILLKTENEDGEQIGFKDFDRHFSGHCDGIISGLQESKQKHIWEHKSVNESKFNKLIKLRHEKGEKEALKEWDIVYYAQAQMYMRYSKLKNHFLTVSLPGGRDYISVRTKYDKKYADIIVEKADTIINDNWNIPAKLSDKREFYKCKWCDYSGICHDGEFPAVNCRTCRYSSPAQNDQFKCLKDEYYITNIFSSCDFHIYNPALIDSICIEQVEDGVIYKKSDGTIWANYDKGGFPDDEKIEIFYSSLELYEKIKNIHNIKTIDKKAEEVKKKFKGGLI